MTLPIATSFPPMEAKLVGELPSGDAWQYEPKWDGFRCLAFKDGSIVDLRSKAGQPFDRYFPELVDAVAALGATRAVLDGVIAKRVNADYRSGERTGMEKYKRMRTADCVVGGFRYAASGKVLGSLLLGLYDDEGLLNHVGFTSSFKAAERAALARKVEPLVGPPGFTGRSPGGPSRWSTERTGEWEPLKEPLVVEVQYDHFSGGRFRHGTKLLRWRPDKAPRQCTEAQVAQESASLLGMLESGGSSLAHGARRAR